MIFDTLINASRYFALHPLFPQVFEFIKLTDLHALTSGKHIINDHTFVIIERVHGRTRKEALLECHRRYIDIQLVLDGIDEMGWKPVNDCLQADGEFNITADIQFFKDTPDAWITVPSSAFCIFFPEDAHAPLVSNRAIVKAVFKVAVNAQ